MNGRWWFRLREWFWRNTSGRRIVAARRRVAMARERRETPRYRRESLGAQIGRWVARVAYGFIALSLALVILFRFVNPPTTLLMESERYRLGAATQHWRSLEQIAPAMRLAVIAAEDARFCEHKGFDVAALRKAVADWRAGGRLIGASTISQQTAKNVFLWPARSLVRKGFEFWFTALIEIFWTKERILEVYLNVAEFGPGVFGVEEAAQRGFSVTAVGLQLDEAARLATVLPAPLRLDVHDLPPEREERVKGVIDGARTLAANGKAGCVGG